MLELEINGKRVVCGTGGTERRSGQPLLLFLHGAGNDHSVWSLQARALAHDGWNVIAPDLPGHGGSEDDPVLDSIAAYADWTEQLLIGLEYERCAVVGHSMGACIALDLAARAKTARSQ